MDRGAWWATDNGVTNIGEKYIYSMQSCYNLNSSQFYKHPCYLKKKLLKSFEPQVFWVL